jgi:hypothetical protein
VQTQGGVLIWSLDFSGDGVWNPAAGDRSYTFGLAGDTALVGDWNSSGTTKIGTVRVDANGTTLAFSLDLSGTGVYTTPPDVADSFGLAGDTAIVGDWNGSGTTKIGTYRPSTAALDLIFSLDKNGDGVFDTGDGASQTGLPGGPTAQVVVGKWKSS